MNNNWTVQAGGSKNRFNNSAGFFGDIRELFPRNKKDYIIFCFGFRFKFQ